MQINDKIYELMETQALPEQNGTGYVLQHKKSGAKIICISNDDENKVFTAAFRTPPQNSRGMAHIVEHTTLNGSEKYPLRDPFSELMKGSLNTYLNAITYSDKTIYPVASCNHKDFQNLMDVYLDAVFHPLLLHKKAVFLQEGWHYVLDEAADSLSVSGIVYNEMKGATSSPEEVLAQKINASLYPDTPYCFESGGDPEEIPKLSYEEYVDFYRRYYHPSNCTLYLYGDMDMVEQLDYIDRAYLCQYEKKHICSALPLQPAPKNPVSAVDSYPISENSSAENKTYYAYSVSLTDQHDSLTYLAMQVLDYALVTSTGAVVKQALADKKLGESCSSMLDYALRQPEYVIQCNHAQANREQEFEETVRGTLQHAVSAGLNHEVLKAGIHRLEYVCREANFGYQPKGLTYALQVFERTMYHEEDAFALLKTQDALAELRRRVDTGWFENLVQTLLLQNPHRAVNTLVPEKGLQEKRDAQLAERLSDKLHHMSRAQKDDILADMQALKDYQQTPDTPEALQSIPVLSRGDITEAIKPAKNEVTQVHGVRMVFHSLPTHGIGYLDLAFDLSALPEEQLPYVGLLSDLLGRVNTKSYSYTQLAAEIDSRSGGIAGTVAVYDGSASNGRVRPMFVEHCRMMPEEIPFVCAMLQELLFHSDFCDQKRMKELLLQIKSDLQQIFSMHAHLLAAGEAGKSVSIAANLRSKLVGLDYCRFIQGLLQNFHPDELAEKLEQTAGAVFTSSNLILSYTGEPDTLQAMQNGLENFLIPAGKEGSPLPAKLPCKERIGYRMPSTVQYVAVCGDLGKEAVQYRGLWDILTHFLYNEYFWQKIRVQGSAYDSAASVVSGRFFSAVSFRDPHLKRTLQVFRQIPAFVRDFQPTERQMIQYILGTISKLDHPVSASMEGQRCFSYYLCGETEVERQRRRSQTLHASAEDMRALVPCLEQMLQCANYCVIGSDSALTANEALFDRTEMLFPES